MTLLPSYVDKAKDTYIVPENITKLENQCFKDHKNLTSITLHNKITFIGDECFMGCENLKEIIIPDSVNYLGHSCFKDCVSLINVKLGNGFDRLRKHTFYNCKLLTKVVIPNSVKKHDENGEIFKGCYNLQTIILSDNCSDINALFPRHCNNKGMPYKMNGYTCTIYGNFSTTDLNGINVVNGTSTTNVSYTTVVNGTSTTDIYNLCNIILKPKSELNTILTDRITGNENYIKSLQEELEHVKKIKSTLISKLNLLESSQGYIGSRIDSTDHNLELSVKTLNNNLETSNNDLKISIKDLTCKILALEIADIKSNDKLNNLEFNTTELINSVDELKTKLNDLESDTEKKVDDKLYELENENNRLSKSIKTLESCYILIFVLIGIVIGISLIK